MSQKNYIDPSRLSKAALGFFAGAALLTLPFKDKGVSNALAIQSCDSLPARSADCYSNCYANVSGYDQNSPLILAGYHPYGECGSKKPEKPPCPYPLFPVECEKGTPPPNVSLWDLYYALVAGRPDVYPFTYALDRYGIPTVATPFSLDNLKRIIDEALRVGPPRGYRESHGPFLRYVRDVIAGGDPNSVIDKTNWVICFWE